MRKTLFALMGLLTATPALGTEKIELLHFWKQPTERAALGVLAERFEQQGGEWYDTVRPGSLPLKIYAIDRIINGYAPHAVHWHGGPEIRQLYAMEITDPINRFVDRRRLESILPSVADALKVDDGIGALPVGLHGENWAWRNLDIYRQLALPAPRDWEHFLEQAPHIRAAGYRPLAVGEASWERNLLFNTVLIDIGGADLYRRMQRGALNPATDRPDIMKAFGVMMRLRDEATSADHAHDDWAESTRDVVRGKAAIQIMGDWAKNEFLNAGKVIGRDFDCALAPGNDGSMSIVLDVFVLPRTTDATVHAAQSELSNIVLDRDIQKRFSILKGSLPVVAGVDVHDLDECTRRGFSLISSSDGTVPSMTLALNQDRITQIAGIVQNIWETHDMSAAEAATLFLQHSQ